jgi:hypothetical protein
MKFHSLLFVCIILVASCHSNQPKTASNSNSSDSTHIPRSTASTPSKPLSLNITMLNSSVPEDSNYSNDGIIFNLNEGDSSEILSMYDGGLIISIDDSTIWFKDDPSNPEDTSSVGHYYNENYELTTDLVSLKQDTSIPNPDNILPPIVGTLMLKAKDGRCVVKRIKGTIIQ